MTMNFVTKFWLKRTDVTLNRNAFSSLLTWTKNFRITIDNSAKIIFNSILNYRNFLFTFISSTSKKFNIVFHSQNENHIKLYSQKNHRKIFAWGRELFNAFFKRSIYVLTKYILRMKKEMFWKIQKFIWMTLIKLRKKRSIFLATQWNDSDISKRNFFKFQQRKTQFGKKLNKNQKQLKLLTD